MATAIITASKTRSVDNKTTHTLFRLPLRHRGHFQSLVVDPSTSACSPSQDPHRLPQTCGRLTRPSTQTTLYLPLSYISSASDNSYRTDARGIYSPLGHPADPTNDHTAAMALHAALHHFRPATDQYVHMPYTHAFNWDELLLPVEMEHEWFAVVTHYKSAKGIVGGPLYEIDEQAHAEAIQGGGLVLYWRGAPVSATGTSLTTCIWQSRAHAITANSGPHHIQALRKAVASCEQFELRRYRLRKLCGEHTLRVEPYDRGDEGW